MGEKYMDKKSKLLEELDEVTLRAIKKMDEAKVEVSFQKSKVHRFMMGLIELCTEHNVSITTHLEGTKVSFCNWETFIDIEADTEGASLHWPRIQTDIVVRRNNEKAFGVVSDIKAES
jgi:hypothetical protein